jgi:hypothetical protein
MTEVQIKTKARHDIHAKVPKFKLGDKVLLKHEHVQKGLSQKLIEKWIGPYEIIEEGPHFTYKLKHLPSGKMIAAFKNAVKLKLFIERANEDNPQQNDTGAVRQPQVLPLLQQQPSDQPELDNELRSALTDDIRIIHASKRGAKQYYRVLWPDNTKDWREASYVNSKAIQNYLKSHTQKGRKRKFHKKKCLLKPQN